MSLILMVLITALVLYAIHNNNYLIQEPMADFHKQSHEGTVKFFQDDNYGDTKWDPSQLAEVERNVNLRVHESLTIGRTTLGRGVFSDVVQGTWKEIPVAVKPIYTIRRHVSEIYIMR